MMCKGMVCKMMEFTGMVFKRRCVFRDVVDRNV